jgi:hypothetical protein
MIIYALESVAARRRNFLYRRITCTLIISAKHTYTYNTSIQVLCALPSLNQYSYTTVELLFTLPIVICGKFHATFRQTIFITSSKRVTGIYLWTIFANTQNIAACITERNENIYPLFVCASLVRTRKKKREREKK